MKNNQLSRKDFLKSLGLGALVLYGSSTTLASCNDKDISPIGFLPSDMGNSLRIPQTLAATGKLTAMYGQDGFGSSEKVFVMGYGGGLLGPTIRVRQGEEVNISFRNELSEPTNIHWHGLVIPPEMDGHPTQMIKPNGEFYYKFKIDQQAGMNWYHPHLHESTGRQVTEGLAGMFIIESAAEQALNLPRGSHEIPLIIQDKRMNSSGTIRYDPRMQDTMDGYLGDHIMVNGTIKPYTDVATRFYRLRVLNGSSARVYNLAMSDGADFYVVGSDNGMLPQPEKINSLLLGSGERVDLMVDFSSYAVGEQVFLMSKTFGDMGKAQGNDAFNILKFNVASQEQDNFRLPTALIPMNKITGSSKTRTFELKMKMLSFKGMHRINNKVFDMERIDESVNYGATEIWEFDNSTGDEPHPMHIHAVQFQVLKRTGGRNRIMPHETGWKDTVLAAPGERVQVIMKFEQRGKFVFHCHNLEHEDDGMMLNFEVK
jgi:FtsP/CotA-like multicopper oxidase with cupredoxin domain